MNGKERVNLSKVIEKMNLVNLTPDIDVKGIWIHVPEFNRPALQLTGFYDQFDNDRIQIIGNVEYSYLKSLSETERYERYMQLLSSNIPCLIFCRNLEPEAEIIELAKKYQIPILKSEESTSSFSAEVIRWLKVQLAPCIVIHGVLVDVYGEGVLITGESGIGKSEAALELIKRGHRLVTDDAVEIRKVSNESLEEEYTEYLGNKVVCHSLPIRPGRNLAVIVEAAAVNHRQKKMGYNAAKELYRRVQENLMKGDDEEDL